MDRYSELVRRVAAAGLSVRGAFHPTLSDVEAVPELAGGTFVLLGFIGSEQWSTFAGSPEARDGREHPLDRWSRRIIDALAGQFGARAFYPSGSPRLPFQRFAMLGEPVHRSPLGLLIHPQWGLWHAYRGALAFEEALALPEPGLTSHPCTSCSLKPCLSACPVGAFTPGRYNLEACVRHVASAAGSDCRNLGCRARRACPVGTEYTYVPAQQAFHMAAFLHACRPGAPA